MKNTQRAQIVNFDLGIGDPITPGPKKTATPTLLPIAGELNWSVYPIETIIAEKLHALMAHGDQNSRSKDVHDLAVFLPKADVMVLKKAVKNCFEYRKTEMPSDFSNTLKKLNTIRLERGWPSATASIPDAPTFRSAFEAVITWVSKLNEL
jgi:predicted nucleotidyltransferase component of viral defense system